MRRLHKQRRRSRDILQPMRHVSAWPRFPASACSWRPVWWPPWGDAGQFYNGRHLAAFLGLVPKQWSTGGKTTLRGISKRGDKYLRRLLIHGARSLCRPTIVQSKRCPHKLRRLVVDNQKKVNVAAVATANTNARIAWALLFYGERYDPDYVARRRWRCEAAA